MIRKNPGGKPPGEKVSLTREALLTFGLLEGEKVLWRFCDAVNHNKAISETDLRIIATAFQKILDGEAPKKALNLEGRPRGRKAKTAKEAVPESRIAQEIVRLVDEEKVPLKVAIAQVAKDRKVTPASAKRYYYAHNELERSMRDFNAQIMDPALNKIEREMVDLFGEGLLEMAWDVPHKLNSYLKALPPSKYLKEVAEIKSIIEKNRKKPV